MWATFVLGDTKGKEKKKGGRRRKEKVANFQRSVVSFKTSAVTIISGFRSFPFLFPTRC